MSEDVSAEVKKAILEQKLQMANNSIYSNVIDKRVAVNCGDKDMEARAVGELKKLEKMKDAYQTCIKELERKKELEPKAV